MIVRRNLLAVHIGLGVALAVLHQAASLVAARAGREQREVHPVAAVDRQVLHLARIDVRADGGFLRVDERRLAGDRHRFGERRGPELNRNGQCLVQQQLKARARDGLKAGERRGEVVHADAHRNAELALRVAHGFKGVSRLIVNDRDRHTRKHAAGRIGDDSGNRRLLCKG